MNIDDKNAIEYIQYTPQDIISDYNDNDDKSSVMYKVEMSPSNMSSNTNMQRLEYNDGMNSEIASSYQTELKRGGSGSMVSSASGTVINRMHDSSS